MNELGNTPADKNYKPSGIVNNLMDGATKAVQLPDGTYITEKLAKSMTKAEERALEVYPRYEKYTTSQRMIVNDMRDGFIQGYEQAEKDIIEMIWWRISEIVGDAQPKPILRAELEELITKIKEQ